jgi:hypothetical protein
LRFHPGPAGARNDGGQRPLCHQQFIQNPFPFLARDWVLE